MNWTSPFLSTVSRLAETRHREDQLGRCFEACFNTSIEFRESVLLLLRTRCRVRVAPVHARFWRCRTQDRIRTRRSHGRLDIVISPSSSDGTIGSDSITFESKLDAPLSARQLLDYRTGGVTNLVAITERYPEVPESWLRKHGIACLRWRDIHRALRPEGRSVDAFVCRAFRDYLEESDMAYKPITVADLTKLGKTFRTIGRKRGWNVNNLAFRTADDVLGLLDEVRRGLADSLPATAARPITATGPGYFFYHGDDDPAFAEHQLTFSLYRRDRSKGGGRDRALLVMFAFPEPASGEASLNVFGFNHVERAVLGRIYSRSLGKLVDHDGHIDVRNVLAFAQSVSRKIGVPVKWALKE